MNQNTLNERKIVSIDCLNDDPYSSKISTFITSIVGKRNVTDIKEILNLIEDALYADSHLRYGPRPELEDRVYVRNVISSYMEEGRPIPILIPWGSIKAKFGKNIDIAEFMAIKQIIHLKERVREIYEPGIDAVLRIEDLSGYDLFSLEGSENTIINGTKLYSNNLQMLVEILDNKESITVMKESQMNSAGSFSYITRNLTALFEQYIFDSDVLISEGYNSTNEFLSLNSYKAIKEEGWEGFIPPLQRNHYYKAYAKLYNGNEHLMQRRLAKYFAGSLTRHKLNMTGKLSDWNKGFIQLSFVPPISGLPKGYNKNYIYYRTIPENYTRLHMPPWRAKGYLAISDKGSLSIKPKLGNWNDDIDYTELEFNVNSSIGEVKISSDYILV